jgi:N-acetylglucosamine kinase-like BadF-type ATPase
MSAWIVGIDAGGTSTRAAAFEMNGGQRRSGRAEGANWTVHGPDACCERIEAAVREALPEGDAPAALCLCIAGYYPPDHKDAVHRWAAESWTGIEVRVEPDVAGAWAGAFGGEAGVVVISGTGSIAYGRSARGEEARAGGWGPLFSDQGSAYAVAVSCLRLLADEADGIGSAGGLAGRLLGRWPELGSELRSWLRGIYRCGWRREEVAAIGAETARAAEEGEPAALDLIERAAEDLLAMARAVARRLGGEPLPLALQGGMAAGALRDAVARRLHGERALRLVEASYSPLEGALLLAADSLGGPALARRVREELR